MRNAFLIVCLFVLSATKLFAQPEWSIQLGLGGLSFNWFALIVENTVSTFDPDSPHQSLRIASGYGLRMFNASYVPVEARYIAFQGTHHLEAVLGVNLQATWEPAGPGDFEEIPRSVLNPTGSIGYRLERAAGGFVFRIGVGGMFVSTNSRLIPCLATSLGYSF